MQDQQAGGYSIQLSVPQAIHYTTQCANNEMQTVLTQSWQPDGEASAVYSCLNINAIPLIGG